MNIDCPGCSKRISEGAQACPYCRAPIAAHQTGGSTPDPRDHAEPARQETPGSYISSGVIMAVFAGGLSALFGMDTTVGLLILVAGGVAAQILLLIGVIAKGVQIGNRS